MHPSQFIRCTYAIPSPLYIVMAWYGDSLSDMSLISMGWSTYKRTTICAILLWYHVAGHSLFTAQFCQIRKGSVHLD
jgi:hypothetical protein